MPFLFLFSIKDFKASGKELLVQNHPSLAQEAEPVFKDLEDQSLNFENIFNVYNQNNNIELTDEVQTKYSRFISCNIEIYDAVFNSTFSFGFGKILGSGGCIFASHSVINSLGGIFVYCESMFGGAISAIQSDILLDENFFEFNVAYIRGGAIYSTKEGLDPMPHLPTKYSQTTIEELQSINNKIHIQYTQFINNTAKEIGGAISINGIGDFFLEVVTFHDNYAGHSAGALEILNTFATIVHSQFLQNRCGNHFIDSESVPERADKFREIKTKHFDMSPLPKGGGAIVIWSNQPENYWDYQKLFDTVTQGCSFCNNIIVASEYWEMNTKRAQRGGNDILIGPQGILRSYGDKFYAEYELAISISSQDGQFINYSTTFDNYSSCNSIHTFSPREEMNFDLTDVDPTDGPSTELYTDPENILPSLTPVPGTPITQRPQPTTASFYQIPILETIVYDISEPYEFYIRSPTPTISSTPTCSTFGEVTRTKRTYINTYLPPYPEEWIPEPTEPPTQTPLGATWPLQTPSCTIPTQSQYGEPAPPLPTQSWWGEIPNKTPIPTISFQGEIPLPTPSYWTVTPEPAEGGVESITATIVPIKTVTISVTYSPSPSFVEFREITTMTKSPTRSMTVVRTFYLGDFTLTASAVESITLSLDEHYQSAVYSWIPGESFLYTSYTLYSYAEYVVVKLPSHSDPPQNKAVLIVGIIAGILVAGIIGVIIFIYFRRKKKDENEEEEMKEETVSTIKSSTGNVTITQDNPLWNDNVITVNDADDPFRSDFEEETNNIINSNSEI